MHIAVKNQEIVDQSMASLFLFCCCFCFFSKDYCTEERGLFLLSDICAQAIKLWGHYEIFGRACNCIRQPSSQDLLYCMNKSTYQIIAKSSLSITMVLRFGDKATSEIASNNY